MVRRAGSSVAHPPTRLAPEPEVQVSIGRVEIRAVAPEANRAGPRRGGSAMSIDEYAARRRGNR
jgi:hypothetical protein